MKNLSKSLEKKINQSSNKILIAGTFLTGLIGGLGYTVAFRMSDIPNKSINYEVNDVNLHDPNSIYNTYELNSYNCRIK